MVAAGIQTGKLFRKVNSAGKPWGEGVTEKLVWHVVKEFAKRIATKGSHLTTCVGPALAYVGRPAANWSRFSFFWGMSLSKRQNATSVVSSELLPPLTTRLASGRHPEIVRALEGWPTIRTGVFIAGCKRVSRPQMRGLVYASREVAGPENPLRPSGVSLLCAEGTETEGYGSPFIRSGDFLPKSRPSPVYRVTRRAAALERRLTSGTPRQYLLSRQVVIALRHRIGRIA
jgi:hypothetical protein